MSREQDQDLADLVKQTIRTLHDKGVAAADLALLVKLYDAVKAQSARSSAPVPPEAQGQASPETPPGSPQPTAGPAPVAPESKVGLTTDTGVSKTYAREGRRGEMKASEDLMARACAIIDVLVQSGQSPEQAAQVITRQLLSVGIQLPEHGGDSRAWKRLDNWRNNLIHHKRSGPAWDVYCAFREQLAHIPPEKRLQMAVGERLWDQRKQQRSSQDIA